jgi:CheY-like chemotaxis protein
MKNTGSKNNSSSFLERSIEILLVDDDWSIVQAYSEILRLYKLYNVTCASCAKEADFLLSSSKRFHVCLMDLGLNDIDNDEYYLIKKHSPKTSFIVATARDSLTKGFQSKSYGAIAAINKPIDFNSLDIINLINEAFFRSLLFPNDINKCKPIIKISIDAFMSLKPASIKQWAENSGIDERYLRMVWMECFNCQPKYLIWLTRVLLRAFPFYNTLYCRELRLKAENNDSRDAPHISKRYDLFYRKHKKEIDRILTR